MSVAREVRPTLTHVVRDGATWPLGTAADVEWIASGVRTNSNGTIAIPAVFDAYATIDLPEGGNNQQAHDEAILSVLREQSGDQQWWLGYLDTGADDVVFPDAPRVTLYSGWGYVLVKAGPEQAASWRRWERGRSFWSGQLPNLMFPVDRSWLVSTLWDDDRTCIGGPAALVNRLVRDRALSARVRCDEPDESDPIM